jgi:hypothetical protein
VEICRRYDPVNNQTRATAQRRRLDIDRADDPSPSTWSELPVTNSDDVHTSDGTVTPVVPPPHGRRGPLGAERLLDGGPSAASVVASMSPQTRACRPRLSDSILALVAGAVWCRRGRFEHDVGRPSPGDRSMPSPRCPAGSACPPCPFPALLRLSPLAGADRGPRISGLDQRTWPKPLQRSSRGIFAQTTTWEIEADSVGNAFRWAAVVPGQWVASVAHPCAVARHPGQSVARHRGRA